MKLLIVLACAAVAVVLAVSPTPQPAQILRSDVKQEADGSYSVNIETDDGYKRQEFGELKEVRTENGTIVKVLVVRGNYNYKDPEGNEQAINYSADEEGFHADGPSIPKNPEPSRR